MTVSFVIKHVLQASPEQFWADIFRSEDFNRALYVEHFGFGYQLELWDPATGRRRARIWPIANIPKALSTVLGGEISLVEDGVWDDAAKRYEFRIVLSRLSDRITVNGSVVASPLVNGSCERTVAFEIDVRLFAIGGALESFLERATREQYDENATFINQYLAAKR